MSATEISASAASVTRTEKHIVNDKTRIQYFNCLVHVFQFLYMNKRTVFENSFLDGAVVDENGMLDATYIKDALANAPANCPMNYERFDAAAIEFFFDNRKDENGQPYMYSYYKSYRAALTHMDTIFKKWRSDEHKQTLKAFFRGFKTSVCPKKNIRIEGSGKKPLDFELFCQICERLWSADERLDKTRIKMTKLRASENVARLLFVLLQWNLCARSKNVAGINLGHISWAQDAMTVVYSESKTDPAGESSTTTDERHIYANPLLPHINAVLALGAYLMVYEFEDTCNATSKLFPGNNPYSRQATGMQEFLATDPVLKEILAQHKLSGNAFGTHSVRKGTIFVA